MKKTVQVAVIQVGARHHYAIPRFLQESEILARFVTDTCRGSGLLGHLGGWIPGFLMPKQFKRWMSRVPIGVPKNKIYTSEVSGLLSLFGRFLFSKDNWDEDGPLYRSYKRSCFKHGWGDANVVYAMLFESSPDFLNQAKRAGLKIVLDVYITPEWNEIVTNERERFPDWEGVTPICKDAFHKRIAKQLAIADVLLCPGQNVVDGLMKFPAFDEAKVRIVPYGCGIDFKGMKNRPTKGRILFAGTAELRKGLPYLAAASEILRSKGKDYEFRVVGRVSDQIRQLPECKFLNFLGRVPRSAMIREYLESDLLVFPTLAEGCAGVVHEAVMACLPVITTKSAGSILANGRGGCLVPERDSVELADMIEAIVENRTRREQLAESCLELHHLLDEAEWGRSVVSVLSEDG